MNAWRPPPGFTRRASVLIPILLAALALAGAAFLVVPTHYVSKTMIVLTIPPKGASSGSATYGTTNPLLRFDGSLRIASSLLVQTMNSPDVAKLLKGLAPKTKITVADTSKSSDLFGADGPFLLITADSSLPGERARSAAELTAAILRSQLEAQQKSIAAPKATYIVPAEVVSPTVPEPDVLPRVKAVAGAFFAGLLGMFGFCYLAAWRRDLRRRRAATRELHMARDLSERTHGRNVPAAPIGIPSNGAATNGAAVKAATSLGAAGQDAGPNRPPAVINIIA